MGLYVRYLAEQGLCVQTALGTVAGSQDPPSTAAAGRDVLPAELHGFRCAAGSPAALCELSRAPCHDAAPCTTHEMESGSHRVPGSSEAQGCKRGLAREQRPWHPELGCLAPPRRLRFLAALCILSTSAIDMGLEPSHAFLRLGQGLCGPAFQGESPLPLCSQWQKGPLCASGSVLPRGRIGTKQPQLGRKWQGGGRGGP